MDRFNVEPGTAQRSPFAAALLLEDPTTANLAALIRRLDHREEWIMAAQDDINAATAALNDVATNLGSAAEALNTAASNIGAKLADLQAAGVDTTELNAAVAAIPTAMDSLSQAQADVAALGAPASQPADSAPTDEAPADPAQPTLDDTASDQAEASAS